MKGRIALKIIRGIQEHELMLFYPQSTVKRAVHTVYRGKRLERWIKSHVRIRFADRTAIKMPDGTYAFMLNEDFDML